MFTRRTISLVLVAFPTALAAQPCAPQWLPGEPIPGTNGTVHAMVLHDFDGDGPLPPRLVIGGYFSAVASTAARGAASWDGATWRPLGSNAPVTTSLVSLDPAGPEPPQLFASGFFGAPSGPSVYGIARWDGSEWQVLLTMDDGLNVTALGSFDIDGPGPLPKRLIAVGESNLATPGNLRGIAHWDGTRWETLGGGLSGAGKFVRADELAEFDPDGTGPQSSQLVISGNFLQAGNIGVNRIAAWDGSAWHRLGSGFAYESAVYALHTFDADGPGPAVGELCVGGSFAAAGGVQAENLAAWNGVTWREFGGGVGGGSSAYYVVDFETHDPDGPGQAPAQLVAIGQFADAGGVQAQHIAAWDGSNWSNLGSGLTTNAWSREHCLRSFDPEGPSPPVLFAGGEIFVAGGRTVRFIATWDGNQWSSLSGGIAGFVRALSLFPSSTPAAPPDIIAGGWFERVGPNPLSMLARFDGSNWHSIGGGVNAEVRSLTTWDPPGPAPLRLIVAGAFTEAGGLPISNIASWDGAQWEPLGAPGPVGAITAFDFDGTGSQIVAVTAGPCISRWDGVAWHQIGEFFWPPPLHHGSAIVYSLQALDPDGSGPLGHQLFAAGYFDRVGTVPARGVVRWDGASWQQVGNGLFSPVQHLAAYDPDGPGPASTHLYAARGTVMRLEGATWQPVNPPPILSVNRLGVYDPDAAGPSQPLLIAGASQGTSYLAAWNGASWQSFMGDVDSGVYAMAVRPSSIGVPELVLGGAFSAVGSAQVSAGLARMVCQPYSCYPNCDGSSTPPILSASDFLCFMNRFAAGDPYTNCDNSITVTLTANDFICFINAYSAGCP